MVQLCVSFSVSFGVTVNTQYTFRLLYFLIVWLHLNDLQFIRYVFIHSRTPEKCMNKLFQHYNFADDLCSGSWAEIERQYSSVLDSIRAVPLCITAILLVMASVAVLFHLLEKILFHIIECKIARTRLAASNPQSFIPASVPVHVRNKTEVSVCSNEDGTILDRSLTEPLDQEDESQEGRCINSATSLSIKKPGFDRNIAYCETNV